MEPVEITLGIPFYNSAPYIQDCLSVLNTLTYPKGAIHLKLIDNESSDGTLQGLLDFAESQKDSFLSIEVGVVEHEDKFSDTTKARWNIINVRNQILERARGHIMMMDSDVVPPSDCVEALLAMIAKGAGICGGLSLVVTGVLRDPETGAQMRYVPQLTAWVMHPDNSYRSIGAVAFSKPHVAELAPEHINSILRVDTIGTGLCMINQNLNKLRFHFSSQYGEDFYFCQTVDRVGFPILVNTGLWYDHTHYLYQKIEDRGKFLVVFKGIERGKGAAFVREAKIP